MSNSSVRAPPRSFARYIAASASSTSREWSASSPGSASAMPIEALSRSSAPPARSGCAISRCSRSATPTASSTPPIDSHSTVNSSPPKRATVSSGRSIRWTRAATSRSTSSPAAWPRLSLIRLNLSTSRKYTAIACVRERCAIAWSSRSPKSARLGSPVSESYSASRSSSASMRLRSVTSMKAPKKRGSCWPSSPRTTVISSRIQMTRPSARLIRYSCTSASPELAHSASALITRSASSGWSSRSHRPPSEIQSSCA